MEYEIEADESVFMAVVRAVSAVEGRDPCSIRPLTDVLDPSALNALFDSRHDGTPRTGGRVSFVFSNCWVSIENGEYLTIHRLDSPPQHLRQ